MVEEIKERTRRIPEIIIADAGYGTKPNYRYLKRQKIPIPAYIPYHIYEQKEF